MSPGNLLLIVIIVLGLIGVVENRGKNGKRQEPAWNMNSLPKEQRALAMEQYKAYRSRIFEEHPQVNRFERNKKRWIGFMILMRLFLLIVQIGIQGSLFMEAGIWGIIGGVWGVFPSLLILFLATASKWYFACFLYLLGAQQVMNFMSMLSQAGIQSPGDFLWSVSEGFKQNPLFICLDVASWIYVLLILLTAMWLTLIPRSRNLAAQAEELNAQMKDFRPDVS